MVDNNDSKATATESNVVMREAQSPSPAFVMDLGSDLMRAGSAGEHCPRTVFRSVVGTPKYPRALGPLDEQEVFVGNEAVVNRGILNVSRAIHPGRQTRWDYMQSSWQVNSASTQTFSWEKIEKLVGYTIGTTRRSTGVPMLMTEAPMTNSADRQRMAEVLYESFSVPALYFEMPPILALYASGRTTGLSLDMRFGRSYAVSVLDGKAATIRRGDVGGDDITEILRMMIINKGHLLTTDAERETVRMFKEKYCFVALDPSVTLANATTRRCELPDGTVVTLSTQDFITAPEALFFEEDGCAWNGGSCIHEHVFLAINTSEWDRRPELYSNIVCSGGTSQLRGFRSRLHKEVTKLAGPEMTVKIDTAEDRKYSAWLGGSIIASHPTFQSMWISKAEYEEHGASIFDRRRYVMEIQH